MFLECLKTETIPPEVVEEFREAGTTFYDGMLCARGGAGGQQLTVQGV